MTATMTGALRLGPTRLWPLQLPLLWLAACGDGPGCGQAPATTPEPKTLAPGDGVVLAEVDGSPITRYELEVAIRETLGKQAHHNLSPARRRALLESLVQSRAIAAAQDGSISAEDRALLDKKVAIYREKELVRGYLKAHTEVTPVNQAMVKDYYDKHLEQFGQRVHRRYEMIGSERSLAPAERDALLSALKDAAAQRDWASWAKGLKDAGRPVFHRTGQMREQVLHERLRAVMKELPLEATSPAVMVDGRVYVLRVLSEDRKEPRPLGEVAPEIRRLLAPGQMKISVKEAAAHVLKSAKVTYH